MKKLAAILCSAVFLLTTVAQAQTEEQDYNNTVSRLDQGGVSFAYLNIKTIEELVVDFWKQCFVPMKVVDEKEQAVIETLCREISNITGFPAFRGVGTSVKKHDSVYEGKTFFYAPAEKQNGLIWDLLPPSRDAREMTRLIPDDAFFATGIYLSTGKTYDSIKQIVRQIGTQYADVEKDYNKFENDMKGQGIDVEKLVKSVDFIVGYAANTPNAPQLVPGLTDFALIVKTKNDAIYKTFLSIAPPDSVKDGIVIIPGSPLMVSQHKGYFFVSNNVANVKARIDNQENRPAQIKGSITSFSYTTPAFGSFLQNLIPLAAKGNLKLELFLKNLISYVKFNEKIECKLIREKDGYLFTCKSASPILPLLINNGSRFFSELPMSAGIVLPALGTARDSGIKANCMNNMKQIGTGCMMYAADHDRYPARLQDLHDYLGGDSRLCFFCPGSKNEYIYFPPKGNDDQINPDRLLLMDTPRSHKNGFTALFADGRVKFVNGNFATAEAQLRAIMKENPDSNGYDMLPIAKEWDKNNR